MKPTMIPAFVPSQEQHEGGGPPSLHFVIVTLCPQSLA